MSLLLMVGMAIALAGCNLSQFKKPDVAQVPQIVLAFSGEPRTFNYFLSQQSPNVFGLTARGLTYVNGEGKIEPELAESWEFSDDNQRVVFTLREGLKWSDGEPLTADDVVFTYEQIVFNPDIPVQVADMLRIGQSGAFPKIRKLDDRRVEFTLPEPFAPFLVSTAAPRDGVAIVPKHALQDSITTQDAEGNLLFSSTWGTDTDPAKLVVNGPYKILSYQPGERVTFERNPYYWRRDAQGNPQPYVERYIWQIVENTDTAMLEFRSGSLDGIGVSAANYSLLKREEKRGNFTIYNGGPDFGTTFISFNLNKGRKNGKPLVDPIKSRWFNTVAFRQAVAYGIDRETMINNLYRGLGEPQNSPIDIQSPYYLSPQEGLKFYNYDPEKAKALLLGAGFQYNNKGQLLDGEGNRVRFTLVAPAGGRTTDYLGSQIKQDLGKIGMQVDFQPIDFSILVEKLSHSLEWDCHLMSLTGGIEPNDGANVWLPKGGLHAFNQFPQPGEEPIEGWEVADWEAEIGRLYIQGAQELDEAKRKEIYAETQRLAQDYLPFIYLVNPLSIAAIRNRIQGIQYSALKGALWNIYELKVVDN
jgi:peptide/nickel transport system substrate-binding protein